MNMVGLCLAMIGRLRQLSEPRLSAGQDRKISDTYRKGYSCPMGEKGFTGDFNARTAEMRDYAEKDDFLAEQFDFDEETSEFFCPVNKLVSLNIPLYRKSQDRHSNNLGYKILDICKNNNLFILNGRLDKDRNIGQFTFRQSSVIDYALASADAFRLFDSFNVLETDPIFSDGHSCLNFSFIHPVCNNCVPSKQNTRFQRTSSK